MAIYNRNDTSIYYEDSGEDLPAVLLIAPGGMKSALNFWSGTSWDPREHLKGHFRVISMDQRNAGRSTARISPTDSWNTYTEDQFGLMDYLKILRFHVAGMCIGGPYCLGMIEAAPERIISAILFQSIGLDENRDAFYAMFDDWATELKPKMPEVSSETWLSFRENMYGGNKILFNVDESFLTTCATPLMILLGNDLYHPQSTSLLLSEIAPNATLIKSWKDGSARDSAMQQCLQFLQLHD